ncbi:MAG: acetoacetate--CoA ligase [Pseudomonadota bacterium]
MDSPTSILWQPPPDRIARCELTRFAQMARLHHGAPAATGDATQDYLQLHAWSVRERATFWSAMWDHASVLGERGRRVLRDGDRMPGARWFEDAHLNYAENLLIGDDAQIALIARDEGGARRVMSRAQLRKAVGAIAAGFASVGIGPGDVVAGFVGNTAEAVIAMLATAWLGATWTSSSPEFGATAVIERFEQTGAKLLVATGGYRYGGKQFDCQQKLAQIIHGMPGLRALVLVGCKDTPAGAPATTRHWRELLEQRAASTPPPQRLPFNSPLFVLYSSGTTGKPKAIVHGAGGTLLQHRKEHLLHTDVRPGDRVFYYTTTGWMMWNWLVSALASQATIVLYDGSPTFPDNDALWRLAAEERINVFGTSPRFLAAMEKAGVRPRDTHDLSALRTILSTGSPLAANQFDYVYAAIAPDVQLASISGGTDIVSCFCLGVPWLPVRRGEIQGAGLGMGTDVVDGEDNPVVGERGELVCTAPFPSMPLGFLGDADGARYQKAYFARFPDTWHHGDYAIRTPQGGFIILGRSDAVLNPGGVRIGTAEIYRQVEQLPEILESLAIGQKHHDDERIVLFVRLPAGQQLDEVLEARIRKVIRTNASPRHVPERIVAVADLPRTMSGKLVELAVRDVVHGLPVSNREALANPEALELFRDLPQLRD